MRNNIKRSIASAAILGSFLLNLFAGAWYPFTLTIPAYAEEVPTETVIEESIPLEVTRSEILTEEPAEVKEVATTTTVDVVEQKIEEGSEDELATPMLAASESTGPEITLHVRYENDLVFEGNVLLSSSPVSVTDNTSAIRNVDGSSAFAALIIADQGTTAFDVSDIVYYAGFDSFLVNCIHLASVGVSASSTEACYNWQFVVNDTYPYVGMDDYVLVDGDDLYVYFGMKDRVVLPTSPSYANIPFDVIAEKYEYTTNTWSPIEGTIVGATQPDPLNPWSPIVLSSTSTKANGSATFTLIATGTYSMGLADNYYYPAYDITLLDPTLASSTATSTDPATTTATTTPSTDGTGGSGGISTSNFSLVNAISFIKSKENGGAYGASLYADWAAIGLAAYGSAPTDGVRNYIVSNPISSTNILDYARRSMALMSLGVNPYNGTSVNYIQEIASRFDGNQFGDANLVNDDLFSILALSKAGYGMSDPEISKSIAFVLSKQQSSGGFESVDITAAAIQILSPYRGDSNVATAIEKAKQYLKMTQDSEGGWQNTFATAWVMQAIGSLGETNAQWTKNNKTPENFIASKQLQSDGGMDGDLDVNSRVWSTSYTVAGYLNKPWTSILQAFSKSGDVVSGGGIGNAATSTNATTTASTSLAVVSSTASSSLPTLPTVLGEMTKELPLFDYPVTPAPKKIAVKKVIATTSSLNAPVIAGVPSASSLTDNVVVEKATSSSNQVADTTGIFDFIKENTAAGVLTIIILFALLGLSYLGYTRAQNNRIRN